MNLRTPSSARCLSAVSILLPLIFVFVSGSLGAQETVRSAVVPPSKAPALSPQEQNGEMLFFQRCALCHLPPLVGATDGARLPFGPLLYGYMDNARNEARVRQVIMNGGAEMPGFQYGLTPTQIEDIVAYMKTAPMKTPPEWFVAAQKRSATPGRGGNPVD
jgi:mono/diheme cytochrome c family protein